MKQLLLILFSATSITAYSQCYVSDFNVNVGACQTDDSYTVDGYFVYYNNPGTGSFVVEVDNGVSTYSQTFNPPFVDGQTYPFSISSIPGDGSVSVVAAYFTSGSACYQAVTYQAPQCSNCLIDYFSSNIGACEDDYTYTVDGELTFTDAPSTGQLIVEVNNGSTSYTQVFNPPFTDGALYSYSISGIPTDGSASTVNAYFTSNPSCTNGTGSYTAPDCSCIADIGTYSASTQGQTPTIQKLCYGDYLTINPDGNVVYPEDLGDGWPAYSPGIIWALYSCPPSVATSPSSTADPTMDPCLVTMVGGALSFAFIDSVLDVNDLYFINNYPGAFTNNVIYFVPITAYSLDDGYYTHTFTNIPCYSMGQPLAVQYLTPITETHVSDCSSGTVTATIQGGDAELNGSSYSIVPGSIQPAGATVITGTAVNGGNIVIGNIAPGTTYSFDVQDANTCSITITGVMDSGTPPDFSVDVNSGCAPLAVTFSTDGTTANCQWTFGDGTSSTGCGSVDHVFMNPGCYDVTLSATVNGCPSSATQPSMVCVHDQPDAAFTADPQITTQTNSTINFDNFSSGAVTYSWRFDDGLTSSIENPVHTYNSDTARGYLVELVVFNQYGCSDTAWQVITINEDLIFYVPNVFTPDGDEFNQTFQPVFVSGYDPYSFVMYIFNRWGEVIFETHDVSVGWDGTYHDKLVQDGTYTWKIEYKILANDSHHEAVGHVNILR